jgi:hypothetical protein
MPVQASAGIAFSDRALRYAEIQQTDRGFRLLRLGQCDFDFDLNRTLTDPGSSAERAVVADAVREALGASSSRRIRAALHPPLCRSFFSAHDEGDPVPAVTLEASLLGFVSEPAEGGIGADAAGRSGDAELLHVTSMRPAVLDNLGSILADLEADDAQAVSALRASAEVVRLGGKKLEPSQCILAVGQFDHLLEVSLVDDRGWRFAAHNRGLPSVDDAVHQITAMFKTLGRPLSQVVQVLTFGSQPPAETVANLFRGKTRKLNPLVLLDLDRDSLDPEYSAAEFVPAVGAALL